MTEQLQTATLDQRPPAYDIGQIFKTVQALGYNISGIKLSESVQEEETDPSILTITFNVTGLPIPVMSSNDMDVDIAIGEAVVHIFAADIGEGDDRYFVEDVIMSNFIADEDRHAQMSYKSFALENMFHALLKTFLIVHQETENKA